MDDLIIQTRETKEKLVEDINNSKLPAFILRPILQELLTQVSVLEEQQYEEAKKMKKGKKKGE